MKEKKKATEQQETTKKKLRRKYVSQPKSDEEKIKSEDISQFRMVSHASKSNLEKNVIILRIMLI